MDKIKCLCAIIHSVRQIQPYSDVFLDVQNDFVTSLCAYIKRSFAGAQQMSKSNLFWVGQNAKMVGKCLNADHYV